MSYHQGPNLPPGDAARETAPSGIAERHIATSGIALYQMHQNIYLGDCAAVVYAASDQEVADNGLTSNNVCLYIKSPINNGQDSPLDALGSGKLFDTDRPIMLRAASSCEFGIFGDSHCDCEADRIASLRAIGNHGQGIYMQLPQEGLGKGLLYKARELELQVNGITPEGEYIGPKNFFEAAALLSGHGAIDQRKFGIVGTIFAKLGMDQYPYTILGSSPKKIEELSGAAGIIIVGSLDIPVEITAENMGVYLAKVCEGITVPDDKLRQIYMLLLNSTSIPDRSRSLIGQIADDLAQGRQFPGGMALLEAIVSTL